MKILIISLPRTGSTSLMNKIAKEKNIEFISEPYDGRKKQIKNFPDSCVVKSIIKQHPPNVNNIIEWYVNFAKEFDDVILLSRKDLKSCWESLSYFTYNEKYGFKSNSDYYWEETPNIDYYRNYILECDNLMNSLSTKMEKKIQYYEDIYDVNSKKRLRKGNKSDIIRNKII